MDWLLILLLSAALGSDAAADAPRHTVLIDRHAQDEAVAEGIAVLLPGDEAMWLDAETERGLVLYRRAHLGEIAGSAIVVAEPEAGPAGRSHAAQIRRNLALHGWHTYFTRLAAEQRGAGIEKLVGLVRQRGSEGVLVLITEGAATPWAVAVADQAAVDGLVLINVPQGATETAAAGALLGGLALPSLVLQEYPHDWRQEDPLGADVELHLLPPGDAGRDDNRLVRKIRGWFKRRYGASA